MRSKKVLIIGAGIGGLSLANLLAKSGFEVSVYEKGPTPGGRIGQKLIDGFKFDTGPSWYLMPSVFEQYFSLLGESVDDWLELRKLSPAYQVFFENNEPITVTGDLDTDMKTFDQIEAGAGKSLKEYIKQSDEIYQLSLKHFLYSNFESFRDFLRTDLLRSMTRLPKLLLMPIDKYVSRFVQNQQLKQILEYPMVFLGTSPFSAPAMYSLMSALDFKEGVYYPQGGFYTLVEAMVKIGKELGVEYHYDSPVGKINTKDGRVASITLNEGQKVEADIVISNADLYFTETELLDDADRSYNEDYWKKKEAGPSALLFFLGIKGKVPELEHHNLLLVDDWEENFKSIYGTKTIPDNASIYISKTSHTDPTTAPKEDENLFILVPLPAGLSLSDEQVSKLSDRYLDQIHEMTGVQLKDRIVVQELFRPDDFKSEFNSWQSSMLGQSHLLKQSAFFRTPNVSKRVKNLFYVGGGTTPGIGVPMCLISAELVYKRIVDDKRSGKIEGLTEGAGNA